MYFNLHITASILILTHYFTMQLWKELISILRMDKETVDKSFLETWQSILPKIARLAEIESSSSQVLRSMMSSQADEARVHNDSRPDGVTMVPWSRGKCLAWDATCVDTFSSSYLSHASVEAGSVADLAEEK